MHFNITDPNKPLKFRMVILSPGGKIVIEPAKEIKRAEWDDYLHSAKLASSADPFIDAFLPLELADPKLLNLTVFALRRKYPNDQEFGKHVARFMSEVEDYEKELLDLK